jgi:hypothetical protein
MERYVVVVIAFGCVYWLDYRHMKKNSSKKAKAIYLMLLLIAFYMGVDYVVNHDWVDYYDVFEAIFKGSAGSIDASLK